MTGRSQPVLRPAARQGLRCGSSDSFLKNRTASLVAWFRALSHSFVSWWSLSLFILPESSVLKILDFALLDGKNRLLCFVRMHRNSPYRHLQIWYPPPIFAPACRS